MSDTPETDKAEDRDPIMYDDWAWIVPANFARRLERERDEARRECSEAQDGWSRALDERDEARRELDLVSDKLCKSESAYLKNEEIIDGLKNEIEHTETFFRDKLSRAADDVNEAKRERDEARRDLVAAEELHRRRFGTLKAEYDAMNVELKQAIDRICQIRLERDNALATLELRVKVWSKEEEAK